MERYHISKEQLVYMLNVNDAYIHNICNIGQDLNYNLFGLCSSILKQFKFKLQIS